MLVPRYGYGRPVHQIINEKLNARRPSFEAVLRHLATRKDLLSSIGKVPLTKDSLEPYWTNIWMPPLDAAVLMHMLAEYKPKRYFEIGSGNSTTFAHHVIRFEELDTHILSIDPQPRRGIDVLCDTVVRDKLESVDISIFEQLEAGDILFFDGSHRTLMNSDVTVFFMELLPSLPPGVIVQIHDIFWPFDYPPEWAPRYYSEQYMLGVYLMNSNINILMANAFISKDADLVKIIEGLDIGGPLGGYWGASFWFET